MDYEMKYKAVLKTATQWIKDGCTDKEKICLECVFPELRESEDLNDEIKKFIEEYGYERGEDKLLIAIVARHFAEWQKEKMIKEMFAEQGTTEEEYLDKSMAQVREMYKKLGITMAKEDEK